MFFPKVLAWFFATAPALLSPAFCADSSGEYFYDGVFDVDLNEDYYSEDEDFDVFNYYTVRTKDAHVETREYALTHVYEDVKWPLTGDMQFNDFNTVIAELGGRNDEDDYWNGRPHFHVNWNQSMAVVETSQRSQSYLPEPQGHLPESALPISNDHPSLSHFSLSSSQSTPSSSPSSKSSPSSIVLFEDDSESPDNCVIVECMDDYNDDDDHDDGDKAFPENNQNAHHQKTPKRPYMHGWRDGYKNLCAVYNHLFPQQKLASSAKVGDKVSAIVKVIIDCNNTLSKVFNNCTFPAEYRNSDFDALLSKHRITNQVVNRVRSACFDPHANASDSMIHMARALGFAKLDRARERVDELVAWMVAFLVTRSSGQTDHENNVLMRKRLSNLQYHRDTNQFTIIGRY